MGPEDLYSHEELKKLVPVKIEYKHEDWSEMEEEYDSEETE